MEAYLTPSPALPGTDRAMASIGQNAGHGVAMNRKQRAALKQSQEQAQSVVAEQAAEQTTQATEPVVPPVAAPEAPAKRSLHVAREANASNPKVDPENPATLVRAALVRPAKGENPERRRVFGYDNGPGGKVPTHARVVVLNVGALKSAYPSLAEAVEATPTASVADLKSAGVGSQSFRRAFRSGLIRFQTAAEAAAEQAEGEQAE